MLQKVYFGLKNVALISLFLFTACGSATNDDPVTTPSGAGSGGGTVTPPANVKVVAGDSQVIVTWDIGSSSRSIAATGSCADTLYLASTSSITPSNWNSVADGQRFESTSPPKIIDGLSNGKSYYVTLTRTCDGKTSAQSAVAGPATPTTGTTTSSTPSVKSFSPTSLVLSMSVGEAKTFSMECVDAEDTVFNYLFHAGPVIKQHLPSVPGVYSYTYTAPNLASEIVTIACHDSTWKWADKKWNIVITP